MDNRKSGSSRLTALNSDASGSEVTLSGADSHSASAARSPALEIGTVLAGRYEIVAKLGEGGMGAVYQARDRELDRSVALKVIRGELAGDPEILQRFKQELILARQVTHKNVIRIYDLAESEGTRFITMEYVEGENLKNFLQTQGKLPPRQAVEIALQIGRALEAAHAEGVIHRDLKPANVMRDRQGKILVMDFGLARSQETSGLTRTGASLGTLEYMSPEQARAERVDHRSDIYSLGLILFELLTGKLPFKAESPLATLLKRTREPSPPVSQVEPTVPKFLSDVTTKCLEIDAARRYQSVSALLHDLEERSAGTGSRARVVPLPGLPRTVWWAAIGVAALAIAAGIYFGRVTRHPAAPGKTVALLIADFDNSTSDSVFDGTLEPALSVGLEGASFITSYNRGQARKAAEQLKPGSTLDESAAKLVAMREGINVVVAGFIARRGEQYAVSARALDAATGKPIFNGEAIAEDKQGVLSALDRLAARIRTALGDTTPESVQIAAAETFTASSLEAAHNYALAQDLLWAGKYDDAIQHYQKSLQLDPELGRAYSGLAVAYMIIGHKQEAMHYYKLALSKIDRMSEREKYRTRGAYYVVTRDTDKAIEELTQLVQRYPADTSGIANLALAYFYRRDMSRALQQGRRAVEISPKNVLQRNNVGLYAMYAGDFDTAIQEQQAVLQLNPSVVKAFVGIALPQMAQGKISDAIQTYHQLEKLGAAGASAASAGLGDTAMYAGRVSDAVAILEQGIAGDTTNKDAESAANKLTVLAEADLVLGKNREAVAAAEKAVANNKDDSVLFFAARAYFAGGNENKALDLAKQLEERTEPDSPAYGKLIEGEMQLKRGKPLEAIKLFKDAQKIADAWLVRFDLGRAYIEAKQFPEADSELELCLKRRGEVTAAFLDEVPTYRLFPAVYYYLGRAQQGLNSPAARESYKTFIAIKEKGGQDPLLADARRRSEFH